MILALIFQPSALSSEEMTNVRNSTSAATVEVAALEVGNSSAALKTYFFKFINSFLIINLLKNQQY